MDEEVVLITGCSSGIGRATARAFLDEDWTVYATARNPADVQTLGDAGAELATLDVTDEEDVERVVDRIIDEEGHVDCLVNNAGYAQYGPIEDVPTDQVHRQFAVNVYGVHRLTRAVLPHMRTREDGTIVNVSSVSGRISNPGGGVYAGSKFAVEAMTDALRNEVDEHGVNVVLVEPGPVDTQFVDRADDELNGNGGVPGVDESGAYDWFYEVFEDAKTVADGGPGMTHPDDVAAVVVNAASATKPAARYPVGIVARVGALARLLPSSIQDKVWRLARRVLR